MKLFNRDGMFKDLFKKKGVKHKTLHAVPYNGTNNRKMTSARFKSNFIKVQSVPVFEKDKKSNRIKFLGYRYINH
jgi:hypothetical protein